jgi:predicted amidohydrolase YtcJ
MFLDGPHDQDLIQDIVASGAFVIPTLTILSSAVGLVPERFAADRRVEPNLDADWLETLRGSMGIYRGDIVNAMDAVAALHLAGVDILAGTDVFAAPGSGLGLAHGASLHHELQLLVSAGLNPEQALRAATSLPARRFGLTDRGRIAPGARADLILVDGDPTTNIGDTLSMRAVWRRGTLRD